MSYSIIDTHCHLDIIEMQGQTINESLQKSQNAGVKKIVQIGIDLDRSLAAKEIAQKYSDLCELYFTIGCHPADDIDETEQSAIADLVHDNITHPLFVGIGEIGLDYYHKKDNWKEQENIFRRFIELSIQYKLPIVIHSRDAAEDTFKILSEYKGKAFGVIHCFTYNLEYAKKYSDLGYYISFSGIVTFNSAKDIQSAASEIPLESILIETDAPFLAPTPYRGKRNEPSYMPFILDKLFTLRKESKSKIEETVFQNSLNFIQKRPFAC